MRHLILLIMAAFIGVAAPAVAQNRLLTAELEMLSSTARSGAPIPVVWTFQWHGSGLLEGNLELTLLDEPDVLARVVVPDVVLNVGEQRLRALLPAVATNNAFSELIVRAQFRTSSETINLGNYRLRVPGEWQRSFAIGVCADWDAGAQPALNELMGELRLEHFSPTQDSGEDVLASRELNTTLAQLRPAELPPDALSLCAFDILVLTPTAFTTLRDNQWETLHDWVDAGGNLCLFIDGILEPAHVERLNDFANAPAQAPIFVADSNGRLLPTDGEEIVLARQGLGHVALVRGTPESTRLDVEEERWREVAAHLWHVRCDARFEFVRLGRWNQNAVQSGIRQRNRYSNGADLLPFSPVPLPSGSQLLTRLMPEGLRVVPLSLMAVILLGFVLVIGPVDYFLLGRLRARKWTWITFPTVTLLVTLLTVGLTKTFMATNPGDRNAVVFLDVGEQGKIVRQNRIEMLFNGTPQTAETEQSRALLTPLDTDQLGRSDFYDPWNERMSEGLVGPATYVGRLPLQYRVTQELPQWTPQVNRSLTIAPAVEPVALNWEALDVVLSDGTGSLDQLVGQLRQALGADITAFLYHGDEQPVRLCGNASLFQAEMDPYGYRTTPFIDPTANSFLQQVSVRPAGGLFSVVSRLAPNGGRALEDVAVLDSSDPAQWLLVVAVERENDLVIYRKLYSVEE